MATGAGVIAYIDMLGFRERAKAADWSADKLEELMLDVGLVHQTFGHGIVNELTAQRREVTGEEVLAFSDCLVISLPGESSSSRIEGSFDLFVRHLSRLAFAQGFCVTQNIFLRGGVDLGFWYHEGNILVSPALVYAYEREESAIVPVLALTERLYNFLDRHPGRAAYNSSGDPMRELFRCYDRGGIKFHFLDYAGVCLSDAAAACSPGVSYSQTRWYWLSQHRDAIITARNKATEATIRAKYDWLVSYHNETVSSMGEPFTDRKIPDTIV